MVIEVSESEGVAVQCFQSSVDRFCGLVEGVFVEADCRLPRCRAPAALNAVGLDEGSADLERCLCRSWPRPSSKIASLR